MQPWSNSANSARRGTAASIPQRLRDSVSPHRAWWPRSAEHCISKKRLDTLSDCFKMRPSIGLQYFADLAALAGSVESRNQQLDCPQTVTSTCSRDCRTHWKQRLKPACPGHGRLVIRIMQSLSPQDALLLYAYMLRKFLDPRLRLAFWRFQDVVQPAVQQRVTLRKTLIWWRPRCCLKPAWSCFMPW